MTRRIFLTAFLACAAASAAALGAAPAAPFNLTLADFSTHPAEIRSIADGRLTYLEAGAEKTAALDDFLSASRQAPTTAPSLLLLLADGQSLTGSPIELAGSSLEWRSPVLGELAIPLKQIHGMQRGPSSRIPSDATADIVLLANGDIVRGVLSAANDQSLTIQADTGDVNLPLDGVKSLVLAANAAPAPPSTSKAFRVRLADGTTLIASEIALADGKLRLQSLGQPASIDPANITQIEQINGPVVWLSGLTPAKADHRPYFALAMPPRMDETVTGGPIRAGDRTGVRGIGMHSYTKMTWKLRPEAAYKTFRTQFALDDQRGSGPSGDVTVRIWLDDRMVFEQTHVNTPALSKVIEIPLAGAAALSLEVDYGDGLDVRDRLNWIEPAPLRK